MNRILEHVKKIETDLSIKFKPTREFYKRVGIGQRRFQMLLRNEVSPTVKELQELAKYFKVGFTDLFITNDE